MENEVTSSSSYSSEEDESVIKNVVPMQEISMAGFKIDGKYEITEILGGGTFGKVFKAVDLRRDRTVALKVTKEFGKRVTESGPKEFDILKKLNSMDQLNFYHIVQVYEGFFWKERFCLAFELLPTSLNQYLHQQGGKGLPLNQTVFVTFQLLQALQYLARLKIIHCDLKPDNIMVKDMSTMEIKVIDFGTHDNVRKHSNWYIQTRHYRAPEVILELDYDCGIDMWSVGCIAAQLHTGRVLFPGTDEEHQMFKIVEALGLPPGHYLKKGVKPNKYFRIVHYYEGPSKIQKTRVFAKFTRNFYHDKPGNANLMNRLQRNRNAIPAGDSSNSAEFQEKERLLKEIISSMLVYEPQTRIKPYPALRRKLFKDLRFRKKDGKTNGTAK